MKLEVLISAMHLKDASIVDKTLCKTDVLIINQTDNEDYYESSNLHELGWKSEYDLKSGII